MRLCIFTCRSFEDPFENTQWRKAKLLQPMPLCLFSRKQFEETFENAQWRKVKNATNEITQASCKQFEDTTNIKATNFTRNRSIVK